MPSNLKSFAAMVFLLLGSFSLHATVKEIENLNSEQRFSEAYQLGQQLLEEEAGNPLFDMAFGVAALRAGEYDQALFAFERVLMFNSKIQVARFELARTHFLLGNLVVARRHFNQLLEADPQPPSAALKRIQWHLAAINAKESGKAIANSDAATRFHLGARLGFDSNPNNMPHREFLLYDAIPLGGDVDSGTYHELYAGVVRYQQQAESWGWFIGGDANVRGYHGDQDAMDSYSLSLQGGGVFLGENWRLSLPVQVNKQVRDDKNEVLILAMAAEFNQRLSAKADYTAFGQLAFIDYKPGSARDTKSFTTGLIYSYRITDQLKLYAGPTLGLENAENKQYSNNIYGLRTGAGYSLNNQQRIDLNFSYMNRKHKSEDTVFNKTRSDDQINMGLNFSHRYSGDWLLELGLQQSIHDSTLGYYTYNRTQVSAGIRKEW